MGWWRRRARRNQTPHLTLEEIVSDLRRLIAGGGRAPHEIPRRGRVRVEEVLQAESPLASSTLVSTIEAEFAVAEPAAPRPRAARPLPAAAKLVDLAVLALPAADRARYREEFQGELSELVAAGATAGQQLSYGLRLISQIWVLRREL